MLAAWYPEFTMPALEAACQAVWDGAGLYSCSQTPFFAVEGGRALGTSRAISAMISSLTGCRLRVVGKPSLDALRAAAYRIGPAAPDRARRGRAAGNADIWEGVMPASWRRGPARRSGSPGRRARAGRC